MGGFSFNESVKFYTKILTLQKGIPMMASGCPSIIPTAGLPQPHESIEAPRPQGGSSRQGKNQT
jgi:hypothetical protein